MAKDKALTSSEIALRISFRVKTINVKKVDSKKGLNHFTVFI